MIIMGSRNQFERIANIDSPCPRCSYTPIEFGYVKKKFTVYFIPTFTISKDYGLHCPRCDEKLVLNQDVGEQIYDDIVYGKPKRKNKRDDP
jgi:hypothetical protein